MDHYSAESFLFCVMYLMVAVYGSGKAVVAFPLHGDQCCGNGVFGMRHVQHWDKQRTNIIFMKLEKA